VESYTGEQDHGTTFTLSFPATQAASGINGAAASKVGSA
jgi:hypothetical protein